MAKTHNKKLWIIMATVVVSFAVLYLLFALFLEFYHEIYDIPTNRGAVMDVQGFDLSANNLDANLYGEWEFFYNKWIETDGYEGMPDTMLKMPGYWTDKSVDGVRFGKHAYASYRMTVINLKPNTKVILTMAFCSVAYRTFINGELCTVSGIVSKSFKESFSRVEPQEIYPIAVPEDGRIEIVMEVASTNQGGMMTNLSLRTLRENPSVDFYFNFAYVLLGIMLAIIVFDLILNLGFLRNGMEFSSVALLLFVIAHYLTSREIYAKAAFFAKYIDYAVVLNFNYLTGIIMLVAFLFHLSVTKQLKLSVKSIVVGATVITACIIAYFVLGGYSWRILPVLLSYLVFGCLFYKLSSNAANGQKFSLINIIMLFLLLNMLILESVDNLGFVFVLMETSTSVILLLFSMILGIKNYKRIRSVAIAELRSLELEREMVSVRYDAYKAQVNPHFIFNVLSGIEDVYKNDSKRGEKALQQFASHLRQHIDAGNRDLIPFEDELKNILNYIELENLRSEKPLVVLFDIEFQEFFVPSLSLQPLIENAVRHSGITKKKDGFLRINCDRAPDEKIRIILSDNGIGFDKEKIRKNATGLKNTAERFRLLLKADLIIQSRINEGTDIIIDIPSESG